MRKDVDISVLFITYNRADLLEITFSTLRERADFGGMSVEFIVSDDASDEPHLSRIKALPFDKHALSPINRGLADNCNKGIAQTAGQYILQIQDDCEFVGLPTLIRTAVQILHQDPEVGLVQLTHQTPDVAHEIRQLPDGTMYRAFDNDGVRQRKETAARPYSDQPHLKRRAFHNAIGPYLENVSMVDMELEYQQRVACQGRWRIAAIELPPGFRHLGGERSFNPAQLRAKRIKRWESYALVGPLIRQGRAVARHVRNRIRKYRI
jgi:hypothetical protein